MRITTRMSTPTSGSPEKTRKRNAMKIATLIPTTSKLIPLTLLRAARSFNGVSNCVYPSAPKTLAKSPNRSRCDEMNSSATNTKGNVTRAAKVPIHSRVQTKSAPAAAHQNPDTATSTGNAHGSTGRDPSKTVVPMPNQLIQPTSEPRSKLLVLVNAKSIGSNAVQAK